MITIKKKKAGNNLQNLYIVVGDLYRGGIATYVKNLIAALDTAKSYNEIIILTKAPKENPNLPISGVTIVNIKVPNFLDVWPLKEIYLARSFGKQLSAVKNEKIVLNYSTLNKKMYKHNSVISIFHSLHMQYVASEASSYNPVVLILKLFHYSFHYTYDVPRYKGSKINLFVAKNTLSFAEKYGLKGKSKHLPVIYKLPQQASFEFPKVTRILCIARNDPFKGVELFDKIAKKVKSVHKDVSFIYVGSKKKLNNATSIGLVSNSQVLAEIRRSCLVVVPSYVENMPYAIVEALGEGVPVISSKVGDVNMYVDSDFMFSAGNADQAAQQICNYLDRLKAKDGSMKKQINSMIKRIMRATKYTNFEKELEASLNV